MSAVGGMLQARITVPTGGWDVTADGGAGSFVATIPAGTYYTTELVDTLEEELNDAAGGTWTLTLDVSADSVSATGRLTIACSSTFSLAWTDTDLGDVLGFDPNTAIVSAASPQTGISHVLGVWMPACPKWSPYGDGAWDIQSDLVQTVGPSGTVKTLIGTQHEVLDGVRWSHVRSDRAIGTDTVGTWQWFWRAVFLDRFSYIAPGDPVRFTWAEGGAEDDVYLIASPISAIPQVVDGWTGLYRIEIARMVRA